MKYLKYIALMLFAVLSAACESLPLPIADITVQRQGVVALGSNSATLEIVLNPTAATIQSVVACYSTYSDMSNAEECAMKDEGNMTYRVELTNLRSNTTYYLCYTVSNAVSVCTIPAEQFTTKDGTNIPSDTNNNYEYVDLGLSVMWATCNVGATRPEGYGDYFAWGETQTKSTYDWSTYSEASDDVAAVKWGGSWRMPTQTEQDELRTQCIWIWTTQNGVKGYKVISKSNGNSIFLPAAGYRNGSSLYNKDSKGFYWSSTLYSGNENYAYYVSFTSNDVSWYSNDRCYGQSVRPVYDAQVTVPTVTTSTVTQIAETTAVAGGNVTSDGGASVTERGVVYSTNPNPVIANLSNTILPCGSGAGAFTYTITNLQPGTTYYIRAYAKNDAGTAYGEEMSFTTQTQIEKPTSPYFSVSQTKYITFSPGNLQYTQSTNIWSFAENQWDMIGTDNVTGGSVSSDSKYGDSKEGTALADKVDLFGWSTSATNFGVSTSTVWDNDYSGSFVDWGTNQIGADAPNTWRTLTSEEWSYLLNTRTNASSLKGVAQVNGVNGLIFLPDNWVCPAGVTFKSGFHSEWLVDYYAAYQTFTAEQWSKLESAGAIFLPAAGDRYGLRVGGVQGYGYYWSATEYDSYNAYYLSFGPDGAGMYDGFRSNGSSVRLVKDL